MEDIANYEINFKVFLTFRMRQFAAAVYQIKQIMADLYIYSTVYLRLPAKSIAEIIKSYLSYSKSNHFKADETAQSKTETDKCPVEYS